MTRVVTPREFGGPEVLELHEVEVPEPGPGEVRVAVRAIAVNAIDWYHYDGVHTDDPADLLTYGYELAGVVEALGPGSTGSPSATRWSRPRCPATGTPTRSSCPRMG